MCQLLAQCREHRVPGWWEGSAFRAHPVGLIVGTIKLTNFWHVDDLCSIEITDGDGWNRNVCMDSCAYGDPHPKPINGRAIRAWRCGAFASPEIEAKLRPRLLEILTSAAEHIEQSVADTKAAAEAHAERAAAVHQAATAAALAKAAGVSA